MELRLKMMVGEHNACSAWDAAQGMLTRAGVWQLWRSGDGMWFVSSTLTQRVGTGNTLCDAIADLDDDVPELP